MESGVAIGIVDGMVVSGALVQLAHALTWCNLSKVVLAWLRAIGCGSRSCSGQSSPWVPGSGH